MEIIIVGVFVVLVVWVAARAAYLHDYFKLRDFEENQKRNQKN